MALVFEYMRLKALLLKIFTFTHSIVRESRGYGVYY